MMSVKYSSFSHAGQAYSVETWGANADNTIATRYSHLVKEFGGEFVAGFSNHESVLSKETMSELCSKIDNRKKANKIGACGCIKAASIAQLPCSPNCVIDQTS